MTRSHIYHQPDHFVNREGEREAFEQLVAGDGRQVLLIRGQEGIGKSGLLHYLIQGHTGQSMVRAFVDFRLKPETGALPEALIYQLGEQLGDFFLDLLDAIDDEPSTARLQGGQEVLAQFDPGALNQSITQVNEAISQAVVNRMAAAQSAAAGNAATMVTTGGGAYVAGNVDTGGGDVIGRDRIDIDIANNFFLSPTAPLPNPGAGGQQASAKIARRRNRLFHSAMRQLLAGNQVILFFDHCEEAEDAICEWISQELLADYLDPLKDMSALRIILVGRSVPWQEQAGNLRAILSDHELKGLELEHVKEYCVEKRGLNPEEAAEIMSASAGIPFLLIQEAEKRLRRPIDE